MGSIRDAVRRRLTLLVHLHPSDDLLLEAVLGPMGSDGRGRAEAEAHIAECRSCADRLDELQAFVDAVNAETAASFDETVSAEHLATQRERIMRRVELAAGRRHPARVLRFPAGARSALATVNRARRWLGAAAGLLVGVTVGQLVHLHPEPPTGVPRTFAPAPDRAPIAAAVSSPLAADEQFMEELELALASPRVSELAALDEMTPRIREVTINVR